MENPLGEINQHASRSFTELEVWKKVRQLKNKIKGIVKFFQPRKNLD